MRCDGNQLATTKLQSEYAHGHRPHATKKSKANVKAKAVRSRVPYMRTRPGAFNIFLSLSLTLSLSSLMDPTARPGLSYLSLGWPVGWLPRVALRLISLFASTPFGSVAACRVGCIRKPIRPKTMHEAGPAPAPAPTPPLSRALVRVGFGLGQFRMRRLPTEGAPEAPGQRQARQGLTHETTRLHERGRGPREI